MSIETKPSATFWKVYDYQERERKRTIQQLQNNLTPEVCQRWNRNRRAMGLTGDLEYGQMLQRITEVPYSDLALMEALLRGSQQSE